MTVCSNGEDFVNFCGLLRKYVLPKFELGIFIYWTCNSMNNLLSYCGLVDAKKRAFYKDLKYIPLEDVSSCVFWPFISYPFRACFCLVDKYSREETIKNGKFLYIVSQFIQGRNLLIIRTLWVRQLFNYSTIRGNTVILYQQARNSTTKMTLINM